MKGMKTLLGVLAAASLLFSQNAFAQENANRDADGNVVRGPYETNALGDNLFVGGGIGLNSGLNASNSGLIPFVTTPGIALEINAGKWITPEYGLRAVVHGITNNSFFRSGSYGFDWQWYLGLDVLFDLSSLIDGYQETREWSFVAYPTAGFSHHTAPKGNTSGGKGWALGAGAYAKKYAFLGNENLDMIIDLRVLAVSNNDIPWRDETRPYGDFMYKLGFASFPVSLTWGVQYKFGKQGFQRHSSVAPAVVPVPFTTEQYEDLSGKVAELEKENQDLKNKVAALEREVAPLRQLVNGQTYLYENGTFTAVDAAAGAPVTLYFDCGATTLSPRELAHFEYFASNVVDADTKLVINGYADKQTGSARRNQYLSEQRVKNVTNLLVKAGATESNIESAAHGASVQPFDKAFKNRVVTIEVK